VLEFELLVFYFVSVLTMCWVCLESASEEPDWLRDWESNKEQKMKLTELEVSLNLWLISKCNQ
jgi:hypothetical protein